MSDCAIVTVLEEKFEMERGSNVPVSIIVDLLTNDPSLLFWQDSTIELLSGNGYETALPYRARRKHRYPPSGHDWDQLYRTRWRAIRVSKRCQKCEFFHVVSFGCVSIFMCQPLVYYEGSPSNTTVLFIYLTNTTNRTLSHTIHCSMNQRQDD